MNESSKNHPSEKDEIPIEPTAEDIGFVLIDCEGHINWRSCVASTLCPLPPNDSDDFLSKVKIWSLFQKEDGNRLRLLLQETAKKRFSGLFRSLVTGKTFSLSAEPFQDCGWQQSGWLLGMSDYSVNASLVAYSSRLNSELDNLFLEHERTIKDATASLIETNVALRKEIRERQAMLETLTISESRFRDLTETTSDFIWEVDIHGCYTYASPRSLQLLGIVPEKLIGESFFLLRTPDTADRFLKMIEGDNNKVHGFSNLEYGYTREDGHRIIVESSGEPIVSKQNRLIGFRGIDRDVTERRLYESELHKAKEMAESANRAKSEFLANMSHELRSPLHGILSYARYGEKRIDTADRDQLLRFFKQITTSGERLIPLIDSLLDLAKLEAGKMEYHFIEADLADEIQSALAEFEQLAEKKLLQLHLQCATSTTSALFDQTKIGQVIRNIITNAIKFSHEETTITIRCEDHHEDRQVMLLTSVSNHGISIPKDELIPIFDKFVQSSKTKTGAGGTGLGLAICKQIISDHGGRIWADSTIDGTTTFSFTLPRSHT